MMRLAAAALGAGITVSVREALTALTSSRSPRWTRSNYAAAEVSLIGGIGTAAGSVAAAQRAAGAAGVVAVGTAGVMGAWDDQDLQAADKGFKGHLRALAKGRVTTGGAKLIGISAASILAAALATGYGRRGRDQVPNPVVRTADVLTCGALIAGSANLLNLFDLRPGRCLKVATALSAPIALGRHPGAPLATGALGVIAASWRPDLAEETMLGDAGANSLGALIGISLALHPDARVRGAVLGAMVALTLLSEKVSFSDLIERTPALRRLDHWGRTG